MIRKALSLSLALIVAGSTAVVAGAPALAQQPQQGNGSWQGQGPHTPNPQREAQRLAKELNLSPDQESRLEPILADREQKMAALRADTSLTRETRRQQMQGIMTNTREQLSTVLTPDQLAQMEARRRGRRRGPGQNGQNAPAQQTPSGS